MYTVYRIFEFVLVVWACVDTQRYRERAGDREGIKYEMVGSDV
jgi:hypothetical protein